MAEEDQIIMTDDLGIAAFDAADYFETEAAKFALLDDAVASGTPPSSPTRQVPLLAPA